MTTAFDKTGARLAVGEDVITICKQTGKKIDGIVTGVSDESFSVRWEDLPEDFPETDYEFQEVAIVGNEIIER